MVIWTPPRKWGDGPSRKGRGHEQHQGAVARNRCPNRAVIDAAAEVLRSLRTGFIERICEKALAIELNARSIPFERQKVIPVNYKERRIGEGRLDLLVASQLLVELKAVEAYAPIHKAQVICCLKATRL